jgi:hypothetical protein
VPLGSAINRGLTFRMAQTPVQHYLPKLLKLIEEGRIDSSFVITDRTSLREGRNSNTGSDSPTMARRVQRVPVDGFWEGPHTDHQ